MQHCHRGNGDFTLGFESFKSYPLTEMVSEIRSATTCKRQFRHSCKHRSDESQRFLVNLHAKSRLLQQNFSITNTNEKHILIFATFENKKLTNSENLLPEIDLNVRTESKAWNSLIFL